MRCAVWRHNAGTTAGSRRGAVVGAGAAVGAETGPVAGLAGLFGLVCLASLMGLVCLVLGAGSASAAPSQASPTSENSGLQYSSDGINFATAIPNLFASAPALAPGASVEQRFWIRNVNPAAVDVSIIADKPGTGVELLVVHGSANIQSLDPGDTAAILLQAYLPVSAENSTQHGSTAVDMEVTVRESMANEGAELGSTGATVGIWPMGAAVLLGGAGLYAAGRRRQSVELVAGGDGAGDGVTGGTRSGSGPAGALRNSGETTS